MNFGLIKPIDSANGPGVRVSLFVSGCRHQCPGCFNSQAWDFEFGEKFTEKQIDQILAYLDHEYISGLTFLGGDPMEPENQEMVLEVISRVREKFGHSKTIWLYTGATYEALIDKANRYWTPYLEHIIQNIDVLVDGPFIEAKKDLGLRFRGSHNQRLIDMPKTMQTNQIQLID